MSIDPANHYFPHFPQYGFLDDKDLTERIFSYLKPDYSPVGGRVANFHLYVKMAAVCRLWRSWVFDIKFGPFHKLGDRSITLLPQLPKSLHLYIGDLNRCLEQRSKSWVDYISNLGSGKCIMPPTDIDVNMRHYNGQTILGMAIRVFLFKKIDEATQLALLDGATPKTLAEALPLVFRTNSDSTQVPWEVRFGVADRLIECMKTKMISPELLRQTLHNIIKEVLCRFGYTLQTIEWLKKWDCNWDENDVASWLRSCERSDAVVSFNAIFHSLLAGATFPIDKPLEKGDTLLLVLLKSCSHSCRDDYFKFLWKGALAELCHSNEIGESAIYFLFFQRKNKQILNSLINTFEPNWLWDIRKELVGRMVEILRDATSPTCIEFCPNAKAMILYALRRAAECSITDEEFIRWLAPHEAEDSILDILAFWNPLLLSELVEQKFITHELLEQCSHNGKTTMDVLRRQMKIFNFFHRINYFLRYSDTPEEANEKFEKIIATEITMQECTQFDDELTKKNAPGYLHKILYSIIDKSLSNYHTSKPLYTPLLDYLLQIAVDPNCIDSEGDTILHTIVRICDHFNDYVCYTVPLLLDRGADPTRRNNEGKSPLDIAKERKLHQLIPLLDCDR